MPNSTILPQALENESDDAPKKFRNIDIESFEFTWNSKPFGGMLPERVRSYQEQKDETDFNGKIISSRMITKYEILKGIEPDEVVIMPKYLVNYAAMHLARKMYKRKMYEGKTEAERSVGIVRIVNPEEEYKLQIQMVTDNFETLPEAPKFPNAPVLKPDPPIEPKKEPESPAPPAELSVPPTPEIPETPSTSKNLPEEKKEEKKSEDTSILCDICGKVCKSNLGLSSHKRFKHKS